MLHCHAENLLLGHWCPLVVLLWCRNLNLSRARCSFVHNSIHKVRSKLNELCLIDQTHCSLGFFIRESLRGQPFGQWCYRKYISKRTLKLSNLKARSKVIKMYSEWHVSRSGAFRRLYCNVVQNVKKNAEFQIAGQIFLQEQWILQPWLLCSHVSPGADWNCLENNVTTLIWITETSNWFFFPHIKSSVIPKCLEKEMYEMPLHCPTQRLWVQRLADDIFMKKEKKTSFHSLCRYIVDTSSSSCAQVSPTSAGLPADWRSP